MKRLMLVWALAVPLAAQNKDVARHLFGNAPLTEASSLPAAEIGLNYLRSLAPQYGLTREDLEGLSVVKEYRTAHNGVTHLLFRQRFQGLDVDNAEFAVNIDRDGQVINAGGDFVHAPAAGSAVPDAASAVSAVRAAAAEVNPALAERYLPFQTAQTAKSVRFHRGEFAADIEGQPIWHAVRGVARPAWKFYVADAGGTSSFAITVDSASQRVLAKRSLTFRQSARGLVFMDSPQPNPKPGTLLLAPPPIVNRTMQSFTGDPVASPRGWVDANETAGNNVIAGTNVLGIGCLAALNCLVRPKTTAAVSRDFSFPLQLGDSAPAVTDFSDAATVNLFYWVNRAHDLFYQIGFDEAAGNFQRDNFGRGGVPGDPVYAYSQFGTAAPQFVALDTASFVQFRDEDGSQAELAIGLELTPAGLLRDIDFDAPTILHEYTHGVETRLVRQLTATFQGAAMAEGFGDFFALEFLTPDGAPLDASYPFSEYPDQTFGSGIRTHPYSINTEVNPLTFADFGRVDLARGPEAHADGEIWAEALWETRAALIQQLGETEGRRRVRLLMIDAMKMAPPAPSMIDMRDAVLLADRVDFKGASQDQIWTAFAKRGFGALAQSRAGAVHISASFDKPSSSGVLKFYETKYVIGEDVRLVLQDSDLNAPSVRVQLTGSSGDLESLLLVRRGPVYVGSIGTTYAPVAKRDGLLELIPGDFISAYYNDASGGGAPKLVQTTVPATPDYTFSLRNPSFRFGQETRLNLRRTSSRLIELPFRFRYFGKDYSYVWVHNYGLLTFDLPDYSPCSDVASLQMINGIAPMWMFITTAGGAQANEDVYVSQTSETVTFRWVAETVADVPTIAPEPVNFAATLYKDGRIQFQYGGGNRNLTSGSQLFGCPVGAPTVGISNGHEAFVELAFTHDSKGTLENAPIVLFDPPYNFSSLPEGQLESPEPDAHLAGVLAGRGVLWDSDVEGGIRRVDVLIDGIAQDTVQVGLPRPDFCSRRRVPGCPLIGFEIAEPLELFGVGPGPHTLQLRATNTRGGFTDLPEKPLVIHVDQGAGDAPFAVIETPAEGARVSGSLTVRGYAAVNDRRVLAVEVMVDGITLGRATYGLVRNDICGTLSPRPPDCPRVGFSFTLDTRNGIVAIPNGTHTLAVRIIDDGIRLVTVPVPPVTFIVNNPAPAAPPKAVLTSPKVNERLRGVVHISGHAWSPTGRVARVQVFIDQIIPLDARYGGPRPDACAQLPDVPGCPAIGFDLDYDTTKLANGPHTIFVVVVDDRGVVTLVPENSTYGVNVVVQN